MASQQQQKTSSLAPAFLPLSIVRTVWKRKLWIAVVWIAVSALTYSTVKRMPSVYKAEVVVIVDTQKIPDRLVSSTVISDPLDRLSFIRLQILTSERLRKVIEDYNLYPRQRQTRAMEDVLKIMRNDIAIAPERSGSGRTISFRVSYVGPDPALVARVANALANLCVEENQKARTSQAASTSEFIETRLAEAKQRLEQLEAAIALYEQRHNGELPRQESSLNSTINRLTMQLDSNRDAITRSNQQKAALQDSLTMAESVERARAAQPVATPVNSLGQPLRPRRRSEELQAQLAEMRLRYSDQHPDVKRLEGQLERERAREAENPEPAPTAGPGPTRATAPAAETPEAAEARSRIAIMKSSLNQLTAEVAGREAEQRRILNEIAVYQGRVSSLPVREQEMAQLTRDYENAKNNYRSLLDKKQGAAMATELEMGEKAEQFTVAEPAIAPKLPFKPNRMVFYAAGSLFGMALGLLLAFAKELHASTLLGEWELPHGVAVLGRLPAFSIKPAAIPTDRDTPGGRKLRPAIVSTAVMLLGALAAASYIFLSRS